jgi:hypothetical protein
MSRLRPSLVEKQAELRTRLTGSTAEGPTPVHAKPHHREQHYTITQLSQLWGISSKSLRSAFALETAGVLRLGTDRVTSYISDSTARRVYARLSRR